MATTTIRNGVDVDRLVATIDAIKQDAKVAQFTFRAESTWEFGGPEARAGSAASSTPAASPGTRRSSSSRATSPLCCLARTQDRTRSS